jgi:hypothetical protein
MKRIIGDGPNRAAGFCECGCGARAPIATQGERKRGFVKGRPLRFLSGHGQRRAEVKNLYRHVRILGHPRAKRGDVYVHVAIAERAIGKVLPRGVEIHHVDGNGKNNAHRNLVVCPDKAYHKLLHVRQRILAVGGNPNTQKLCGRCRTPRALDDFSLSRSNKSTGRGNICRDCTRRVVIPEMAIVDPEWP